MRRRKPARAKRRAICCFGFEPRGEAENVLRRLAGIGHQDHEGRGADFALLGNGIHVETFGGESGQNRPAHLVDAEARSLRNERGSRFAFEGNRIGRDELERRGRARIDDPEDPRERFAGIPDEGLALRLPEGKRPGIWRRLRDFLFHEGMRPVHDPDGRIFVGPRERRGAGSGSVGS